MVWYLENYFDIFCFCVNSFVICCCLLPRLSIKTRKIQEWVKAPDLVRADWCFGLELWIMKPYDILWKSWLALKQYLLMSFAFLYYKMTGPGWLWHVFWNDLVVPLDSSVIDFFRIIGINFPLKSHLPHLWGQRQTLVAALVVTSSAPDLGQWQKFAIHFFHFLVVFCKKKIESH